ncbi:hypothetical protein CULT_1810002 [[Clostridium] ultunense Esp]|nr:hypothetical protein CULT_1810002 [[Clostridium] ultunense Esp]
MDQFLKINRIFVEDWIQRLIQETNNLSRHALIPKMLQKPNEIELMLKQALHKVHSSSERAIMRVFVDNGQRYDLLEKLRNTPYKMNEDLEKWIIKTIGKDEYTVTFNGITKWNDDMHIALMNEIIQPIVENIGVPYAGVDTYAFIANAGYTPFGIHDDRDHSLIFHLGPSVKHCWIWPRSLYIELTGNDNRRFDPESLKKYGELFVLEPGDLLFIPKGDFHVFQNVGYSIFLGFILFPSNAEVIGREAIITLAALNGNVEESFVSQDSLEKRMYEQLDVLLGQERDNAYGSSPKCGVNSPLPGDCIMLTNLSDALL